ncbi:thioredoxin-dependent thiol peroxidase [Halobacteriales archaeon QS_8_69_26]|nr:MAG: thioredoxin-dependent thiol peroxidase [Halobacteriales archaeon QS_8_69_26]
MLEPGQEAPEFELPNQDGDPVSLSEFEGQRVVLYFYPRADTRGCTIEAKGFRDNMEAYEAADVAVLGISNDPVEDIADFAEKYDLEFDLLSDEDGSVAEAYESFGTIEMEGETHDIAYRNTFVIGPDGRIEVVYEGVDPGDHPEELLADLGADAA